MIRRLSKTTFKRCQEPQFVDVSPKVQPVNGGVIVIFQVVQRPMIHYIMIIGCENELRSSLLTKPS